MTKRRGLAFLGLLGWAIGSLGLVHCVGDDPAPTTGGPGNPDGSTTNGDGSTNPPPSGTDAGGDATTNLPLFTDAVSVTAGANHTCAISAAQDVYCWGSNSTGQLGVPIAQVPQTSVPVKVDVGGKATAIAAGANHTCVIMATTGVIKCWGNNERGQLGRGSFASPGTIDVVSTPGTNATLWTKADAISAGAKHTCALMHETDFQGFPVARAFCWGENATRQLGTNINNGQPITTPSLITLNGDDNPNPSLEAFDIAAGDDFSCSAFVVGAGAAFYTATGCWGNRSAGQVGSLPSGNPQVAPGGFPTLYPDGGSGNGSLLLASLKPALLATGAGHGCVRLEQAGNTTRLVCWGNNTKGQTGSTDTALHTASPIATFDASNVTGLAAGGEVTCVIDSGQVKCMGANDVGQLGHGTLDTSTNAALADVTLAPQASSLAVGTKHACAVLGSAAGQPGKIACWGQNQNGQLGDGLDIATGYAGAPAAELRVRKSPVNVLAPK